VECAGSPAFRSGRSGGHGKGRGQACGHGSAQIGIASAWIAHSRSGARVRVAPSLRTPCTCAGFVFRGSPWIGRDPAPFQALVPEIAAIAADCRGFAAIRVRLGDRPELWSPPSISGPAARERPGAWHRGTGLDASPIVARWAAAGRAWTGPALWCPEPKGAGRATDDHARVQAHERAVGRLRERVGDQRALQGDHGGRRVAVQLGELEAQRGVQLGERSPPSIRPRLVTVLGQQVAAVKAERPLIDGRVAIFSCACRSSLERINVDLSVEDGQRRLSASARPRRRRRRRRARGGRHRAPG